jgi:hypothetical protein
MRVDSATEAMGDIYESQSRKIEDYVNAIAAEPKQRGAVFAINGRVAGMELFDSEATFRRFMAKLVRGYAMDALEEPQTDAGLPGEDAARQFLDDVKAAAVQVFPALGEGEDLRIESPTVAGGALHAGNRIVHLCAFRPEKSESRPDERGGGFDSGIPAFLRRGGRVA